MSDPIRQVLWLGPARPSESMTRPLSASEWWNTRLIDSMPIGITTDSIAHDAQSFWPRGALRTRSRVLSDTDRLHTDVEFVNLPFARLRTLRSSYRAAVDGAPHDLLVTYNPYDYNVATGIRWRTSGRPWLCVHADGDGDARLDRSTRAGATHHVYLSWHDFINHSGSRGAIHLDGGIDLLPDHYAHAAPRDDRPLVLYFGALSSHAGAESLVPVMRHLDPDVRLAICGPGRSAAIDEVLRSDEFGDRLEFLGLVDEEQLADLARTATCFVNPRPDNPDSQHNFPSKVLRYLSFNRPIASTRTPGIAPDYDKVIDFSDEDTAAALAATIMKVVSRDDASLTQQRRVFVERRSWANQATRLVDYVMDR